MDTTAAGFTQVQKKSLADRIHDDILEMVIQNMSEEEMVLTEGRLVEVFGVSKAPVREALIRLCSEGVLRNIPRFGYLLVKTDEKDNRDMARIRVLLETEALRAGFETIVPRHLEDIRRQIEKPKQEGIKADIWKIWDDNEAFHLLLASWADNRMINRFLKESLRIQKRAYAQNQWNRKKSLEAEINLWPHRKIYEALCEGDLEKSCRVLEEDIMG